MGLAAYHISREQSGWCVRHGDDVSQPYSTREAAFEVVVLAASNALKSGDGVKIEVDGPQPNEAALGKS